MVTKKNPLLSQIDFDGKINSIKNNNIITNKGYMSNTTNNFKIGLLSNGSWVAQDIVLNSIEA